MPVPVTPATKAVSDQHQPVPSLAMVPFVRGARRHWERGESLIGIQLSSVSQVKKLRVPIHGWMEMLRLHVRTNTAGTGGTAAADYPWNIFGQVKLRDVNGTDIWNLDGYSTYLANQFGGYWVRGFDITGYPGYSATATAPEFVLDIPLRFGRDGVGLLPNMDASAQYEVELTINPVSVIYSTAPTTNPIIDVNLTYYGYSQPPASDPFGAVIANTPPGAGSVQFWKKQTIPVGAAMSVRFEGRFLRNVFMVVRDGSNARVNLANFDLQVDIDGSTYYVRSLYDIKQFSYNLFGVNLPNGVVPLHLGTYDPDFDVAAEAGDLWMPTLTTTQWVIRNLTQGATAEILVNDLLLAGDVYAK